MYNRTITRESIMRQVIDHIKKMRCSRFDEMKKFIQHGDTSCYLHTIAVAYYSCICADKLGMRVNNSELIRGALLHDYFLYDWHDKKKERRVHGFTHPGKAYRNAKKDFMLSKRESDIIKKHMFPLTICFMPMYRESWIVCIVDKYCSLIETFNLGCYKKIRLTLRTNKLF